MKAGVAVGRAVAVVIVLLVVPLPCLTMGGLDGPPISPRPVAAGGVSPAASAVTETLTSVPSRPGITQFFMLVRPDGDPVASAILFAGSEGNLRLAQGGGTGAGNNFLVHNRVRFAAHGVLVAVIDAPSDREPHGLTLFRSTAPHAQDVQAVIAALRRLSAVAAGRALVGPRFLRPRRGRRGAYRPLDGRALTGPDSVV